MTSHDEPHVELPVGYHLGEFLGRGSYGEVYLIERDQEADAAKTAEDNKTCDASADIITSAGNNCGDGVDRRDDVVDAGGGDGTGGEEKGEGGEVGEGEEEEEEVPSRLALKRILDIGCVQRVCVERYKEEYLKRVVREVQILRLVAGLYEFVNTREVYLSSDGKDLYILMDYVPSTLKSIVSTTRLEMKIIRFITAQLLCGLEKLERLGCAHRDLSARNILVDVSTAFVTIADFGLGRARVDVDTTKTVEVVTMPYRAPELLFLCKEYDAFLVDVWSVGILLAEMLVGEPPVIGKDVLRQLVGTNANIEPLDVDYWIERPDTPSSARQFLVDNRPRFESASTSSAALAVAALSPAALSTSPAGGPHATPFPLGRAVEARGLSAAGVDVLRGMLATTPDRRLRSADLLALPWFDEDPECREQIDQLREQTLEGRVAPELPPGSHQQRLEWLRNYVLPRPATHSAPLER